MAIPNDIGFNPTFNRLNKNYLISICGKNSDSVHLFDTNRLIWFYVGRLQSGYRKGAYAIYLRYYKIVMICGGITEDEDNSLDIEYFDMKEFENKISNEKTENKETYIDKIKDIPYDFFLRKSFPIILNVKDNSTYIICGGGSLISDTDTLVIFETDQKLITMSNIVLPIPLSEENPNTFQTKDSIYFFGNNNSAIRFNFLEKSFKIIDNKFFF